MKPKALNLETPETHMQARLFIAPINPTRHALVARVFITMKAEGMTRLGCFWAAPADI